MRSIVGLIVLALGLLVTVFLVLVSNGALDVISLPIVVAELIGILVAFKAVNSTYGIRRALTVVMLGILVPLAGCIIWLTKHPTYVSTVAMQIVRTSALANTSGSTWTETNIGQVAVRYHVKDTGAEEVIDALPNSVAKVQAAFTKFPDQIYVFVFPDRPTVQKDFHYKMPEGFNGAGMGSDMLVIVSPVAWSLEDRATKPVSKIVTHELTHDAVAYIGGPKVPKWLNEGLAIVVADQSMPTGRSKLAEQVASGRRYSLEEVNAIFQGLKSLDDVGLGYELSGSVVQFMVDQYSSAKVQQVLSELGSGHNLDQALMSAIGTNSKGFEEAWNQWMISREISNAPTT